MSLCASCGARLAGPSSQCPFCGHDTTFQNLAQTERYLGLFWKLVILTVVGGVVLGGMSLLSAARRSGPDGHAAEASRQADDHLFRSARQAIGEHRWNAATSFLEEAQKKFPRFYLPALMLAQTEIVEAILAHPQDPLPSTALPYLEQAGKQEPTLAGPHFWMAVYLQSHGKSTEAQAELALASRYLPDSYPYFTGRTREYGSLISDLGTGLRKGHTILLTCRMAGAPKLQAGSRQVVIDLPLAE